MSIPSGIEAGSVLETRTYPVTRAHLVRYAGASGDFNPIHWSDRVATAVGLPGVIAHGMLTQALAARAVAEWTAEWSGARPPRSSSWVPSSRTPSSSPTTTRGSTSWWPAP
ncbi:MaoC/PaaZ C-terminal domain-containing protein [Nocardioides zeae]